MRRILTCGAAAVALSLGCNSVATCDCLPSRTSLVVYGEVRTAAGTPAASSEVRFLLAPPVTAASGRQPCDFAGVVGDPDPAEVRTDAAGKFRSEVFSTFGPARRCLRVTATAPGTGGGSANVDGLLVSFRLERPDSVGLVMTLR